MKVGFPRRWPGNELCPSRPWRVRTGAGLDLGPASLYYFLEAKNPDGATRVITVAPDLEPALNDQARKRGVAAEALALQALRERFLAPALRIQSRDEWEQRLRSAAPDCGVSLANEAVSSEGLYD